MISKKTLIIVFLFANLVSWSFIYDLENNRNVEVCFFDAGQGDSALIKANGKNILIDGGPNSYITSKVSKKLPYFNRSIDLVILTHPHSDHINGLINIFDKFKVNNFLSTGQIYESKAFNDLEDLVFKENAKQYIAKKGLKISLSEDQYLKIIYPFYSLDEQLLTEKEANDSSIVLQFNSFNDTMLFTGDASYRIESEIIEKGIDISSDILKVAHHGSKYSTTDYFLNSVMPKLTVISVGENNYYNHPAKETLDRLDQFKIKVVRTDKNGDICLTQKKIKQFSLSSQME